MDGKTKAIPAMHVSPDSILAAALRTADDHGVPVKALECADAPERTIYRWKSEANPHASFSGGVAVIRRMPEEMQVAAVRQLFPDIHVGLEAANVSPASSPLDGAINTTVRAAEVLAAFRLAATDGAISISEAAALNSMLDRFEQEIEATRGALASSQRRTGIAPKPLSLSRTAPSGGS